ncbi:MAG: ribosomal-protein-alanine N-acetyltransferase [Caldilinea sp. CFX5]|nr:ribosomal-protein-alanine N-acetyltransferase [Caldilinea sp. CFX5]
MTNSVRWNRSICAPLDMTTTPEQCADPHTGYTVACAPLTVADVPQVAAVEVQAFPSPRSATFYRQEVTQNQYANYRVIHATPSAVSRQETLVVAYGGYWLLGDDAHIIAIAVHPDWRKRGLAEWLMLELATLAQSQGATVVTLEMRASNTAAHALYRKLGFQAVGRRKRYYRDTDEDALLFTLAGLQEATIQNRLAARLEQLRRRWQS